MKRKIQSLLIVLILIMPVMLMVACNGDSADESASTINMNSVGKVIYNVGEQLDVTNTKITVDNSLDAVPVLSIWVTGGGLNNNKVFTVAGTQVLTVEHPTTRAKTNFSVIVKSVIPNGAYSLVAFESGEFSIDFADTTAMLNLINNIFTDAVATKANIVENIETALGSIEAQLTYAADMLNMLSGKWVAYSLAGELAFELEWQFAYDYQAQEWIFDYEEMHEFIFEFFVDNNMLKSADFEDWDIDALAAAIRTEFNIDETEYYSIESAIEDALDWYWSPPSVYAEIIINGYIELGIALATEILANFEETKAEIWKAVNKVLDLIPDNPTITDVLKILVLVDLWRDSFAMPIEIINHNIIGIAGTYYMFDYDGINFTIPNVDIADIITFAYGKFIITFGAVTLTFAA